VLRQTRQDFEVIIVDDGSTDDTLSHVAAFTADPRIRIREQPNRGPSAARNAGIAIARGELVCMLDSDDLWLPEYLEIMGDALDADPRAGFAYTDAYVLHSATRRIRRTTMMHYQHPPKTPLDDPDALLRRLLDGNFIYTSVTVRRSVLDLVGPFDERLWTAEEWELWLRIASAGFPAVRPPGVLGIHRSRPNSLSADLPRMLEGVCEVYRIVAEEWQTSEEIREVALAARARRERELRLLQEPGLARTQSEHARELLTAVAKQVRAPFLWRREPPAEVAATLAAVS
jgi:glycosyltransferase involved in cell wall biosynthesis